MPPLRALSAATPRLTRAVVPVTAPRPATRTLAHAAPPAALKNRIFDAIRSTADFDTARLASPSPLLTLWTASWCPSCRAVKPVIQELVAAGVGESATTAVGFVEVELDSSDISDVATRYMLSTIPTLLSFRQGEAHMASLVGDVRLLSDRAFLTRWIEDEAKSGGPGGPGKSLFGGFFGALPFRGRGKEETSPWA